MNILQEVQANSTSAWSILPTDASLVITSSESFPINAPSYASDSDGFEILFWPVAANSSEGGNSAIYVATKVNGAEWVQYCVPQSDITGNTILSSFAPAVVALGKGVFYICWTANRSVGSSYLYNVNVQVNSDSTLAYSLVSLFNSSGLTNGGYACENAPAMCWDGETIRVAFCSNGTGVHCFTSYTDADEPAALLQPNVWSHNTFSPLGDISVVPSLAVSNGQTLLVFSTYSQQDWCTIFNMALLNGDSFANACNPIPSYNSEYQIAPSLSGTSNGFVLTISPLMSANLGEVSYQYDPALSFSSADGINWSSEQSTLIGTTLNVSVFNGNNSSVMAYWSNVSGPTAIQLANLELSPFTTSLPIVSSANWMGEMASTYGSIFSSMKLRNLCLMGSHDTGTYGTSFAAKLWAEAQDLDMASQLSAGARYFDIRPMAVFDTVDVPIVLYTWHTVEGVAMNSLLGDVQSFLNQNKGEIIILKFSHPDVSMSQECLDYLGSQVKAYFGDFLFTYEKSQGRLCDKTYEDIVNFSGQLSSVVIAVFDSDTQPSTMGGGIYAYRDYCSADASNGDLTVFDEYSDIDQLVNMVSDQANKVANWTGLCTDSVKTQCDLLLLSWTLTGSGLEVISDLANVANSNFIENTASLSVINNWDKINILFNDYIDSANAFATCLQFNIARMNMSNDRAKLQSRSAPHREDAIRIHS